MINDLYIFKIVYYLSLIIYKIALFINICKKSLFTYYLIYKIKIFYKLIIDYINNFIN